MSDGSGIVKIDLDKVDWRGSREFFESLGEALDKLDDKDESYDFTWVGKRKAIIEAGAPINKTFRPDVAASKNWETTENLFIEGDNLDALKLLQESYLGKVKMIYIDPPYNTGKDFVYHDNFRASVDDYDEDTEYRDEEGNIQFRKDDPYRQNLRAAGRYHSDWLSMIYPRLKLARNLLTDDGIIFISIDDNEQANLIKLCDEIYGEDNFIGTFIVNSAPNARDYGHIGKMHDYVLAYAKSIDLTSSNLLPDETKVFKYKDEIGGYNLHPLYNSNEAFHKGNRPNLYYAFYVDPEINEAGFHDISLDKKSSWAEVYPPQSQKNNVDFVWRWGKQKSAANLNNEIVGYQNGDGGLRIVQKMRHTSKLIRSMLTEKTYSSRKGTSEVEELFKKKMFDFPKPISLLKDLSFVATNQSSIVLDFFSGSGTTAHAVMQLNAEDGGSRRWITVQLPEETDGTSEAYKAGYKTIPEVARERIRRAGDKIAAEHPDAKVDYGFRALTVAGTNYKDIYKPAGQLQQGDLLASVDNVKEDRTELDLLYGVLTQSALELNRPISTTEVAGATIYQYDYFGEVSGLIACFAKDVPEEVIKAIAVLKPLTAVFRDSSFANSQAKVNLSEHFRILSPDTKVKVI